MQGYSVISPKLNHHDFLSKYCYNHHPRTRYANSRRSNRLCVVGDHSLSAPRIASKPANLLWLPSTKLKLVKVNASASRTETDEPKWWEKSGGPNMIDINSTQEFLDALSNAGNRLVIVDFYGTWCGSCRALFPKLCKIAIEHPEIVFLKVNFDENKPMCKNLNVKVLPYFHFYRGADGLVDSFSCSLAKLQKLKDAIANHNKASCSESAVET